MRSNRTRTLGVLAAVAVVAVGCGGGDVGPADASDDHQLEAGDLYFEPEDLAASAGDISFTLDNVGAVEHNLVLEDTGEEIVGSIAPGESASGSITLEAGSYTLYCSVVGHREAGMEATLDVE